MKITVKQLRSLIREVVEVNNLTFVVAPKKKSDKNNLHEDDDDDLNFDVAPRKKPASAADNDKAKEAEPETPDPWKTGVWPFIGVFIDSDDMQMSGNWKPTKILKNANLKDVIAKLRIKKEGASEPMRLRTTKEGPGSYGGMAVKIVYLETVPAEGKSSGGFFGQPDDSDFENRSVKLVCGRTEKEVEESADDPGK